MNVVILKKCRVFHVATMTSIRLATLARSRSKFGKMVAWSTFLSSNISKGIQLRSLITGSKYKLQLKGINFVPIRAGGHGPPTIEIRETQYTTAKFKNYLHMYVMLIAVPVFTWTAYANIFIGKATLALIPEGYEPKHWEYHKHPITRFLAKYCMRSPQESYERNLHNMFKIKEKQMLKALEYKVEALMAEKQDYQAWYLTKPLAKYKRLEQERAYELYERSAGYPHGRKI